MFQDPAQRLITYFEQLRPDTVALIGAYYTEDAVFKDPFNEVRSSAQIEPIFSHMFEALEEPRFEITERIVQGRQCFLVWNFKFRFRNFHKGALQTIQGGSHLRFADDGRVNYHRDYWDAAEELYEKLPLVGGVMRWLKKRVNN